MYAWISFTMKTQKLFKSYAKVACPMKGDPYRKLAKNKPTKLLEARRNLQSALLKKNRNKETPRHTQANTHTHTHIH